MFFYFVRHGLTHSNVHSTVQGATDPLTETGEKQARHVANRLKELPIEVIYSSDYARAHQTAKLINETLQKEIVISPLLREVQRPSQFHGLHNSDPGVQDYTKQFIANMDSHDWKHSDEESFNEIMVRTRACLAFLLQSPHEHNLVVTHGNFLRTLLTTMMIPEGPSHRLVRHLHGFFRTSNTGISTVEYSDHVWEQNKESWKLATWNDHIHLSEIE